MSSGNISRADNRRAANPAPPVSNSAAAQPMTIDELKQYSKSRAQAQLCKSVFFLIVGIASTVVSLALVAGSIFLLMHGGLVLLPLLHITLHSTAGTTALFLGLLAGGLTWGSFKLSDRAIKNEALFVQFEQTPAMLQVLNLYTKQEERFDVIDVFRKCAPDKRKSLATAWLQYGVDASRGLFRSSQEEIESWLEDYRKECEKWATDVLNNSEKNADVNALRAVLLSCPNSNRKTLKKCVEQSGVSSFVGLSPQECAALIIIMLRPECVNLKGEEVMGLAKQFAGMSTQQLKALRAEYEKRRWPSNEVK